MKIGEYDVKLSPLGWITLAAAAVANAIAPGRGFRKESEQQLSREGNQDMAYRLSVFIVNPDDEKIYVKHEFYGETKADAEHVKQEHLASCAYFKTAEAEGRTDEEGEEISADEWPTVDEDDEEEE
jgi:hypothetical protein